MEIQWGMLVPETLSNVLAILLATHVSFVKAASGIWLQQEPQIKQGIILVNTYPPTPPPQ